MENKPAAELEQLQQLLSAHQYTLSAAVTNGFVVGMQCAGIEPEHDDFIFNLQQVLNEGELLELTVIDSLKKISLAASNQLDAGILQLKLAIEDVNQDLSQNLKFIAQWSEGWLLGFGHATDSEKLSKDAIEVLADIRNISQVEFEIEDEDDKEELEKAYVEILEHLKVSVEMLYLEKKQLLQQSTPAQKSDIIH